MSYNKYETFSFYISVLLFIKYNSFKFLYGASLSVLTLGELAADAARFELRGVMLVKSDLP